MGEESVRIFPYLLSDLSLEAKSAGHLATEAAKRQRRRPRTGVSCATAPAVATATRFNRPAGLNLSSFAMRFAPAATVKTGKHNIIGLGFPFAWVAAAHAIRFSPKLRLLMLVPAASVTL
jgi:hypothetical protein